MKTLLFAGLLALLTPAHASTVFEDTFDRTDSRNIQAVLTGITNNTGAALAAGGVYSQPHLDPANASPTFGTQDGVAANGGGAQILTNRLRLAVGAGTSNAFANHNFINPAIVTAGGFSVTLDVTGFNQTTAEQGGGFAIGMSQAEAAACDDAWNAGTPLPSMTGAFNVGATIGNNVPGTAGGIKSDFWVAIRGNNSVVWGGSSGTVKGVTGLAAKTGTLAVNFHFTSFTAGSPVTYDVILNSVQVGTGNFNWSGTNENYIGIDGRDSGFVEFDNFRVATDFIVPTTFPPSPKAFEITKLQGTSNTRFHWRVAEGTLGNPVTVTIKNDATSVVVSTSNNLNGFADVTTSGSGSFTLTASNSSGPGDPLSATFVTDDALDAAIAADSPTAWYRFSETIASALIVDSATNAAPHDGSVIGNVVTGYSGPRDYIASFPGAGGSILTDLIFNPSILSGGYTVEAIVRRTPGSQTNAAIVSQIDGTGVGRSHLAVDTNSTIQSFVGGGGLQRKDADVKLKPNTWAHLVMVVDPSVPEIRWYLDGTQIGTTTDGLNPDGSTFNPNFTVESATGAWRIGTQKFADQNFWAGDMDEVVVYSSKLDDPDGNGNRSDSRVAAHTSAWLGSASGLLGFFASADSITAGGSTTLTVKVGANVTSVSIGNGIGTVVPVNGVVTIPVHPTATTDYVVTVDGEFGEQIQIITIQVQQPPVITSVNIVGGNFNISFTGNPSTIYKVKGSLDLLSFPIDHGTATTDVSGIGAAVVPLVPGEPRKFFRIETSP